ncbi:unnamed protein product, partial [Oppiella nova]
MTVDWGQGPVDITKLVPGFDTDGCHMVKCPIKKGDTISIVHKEKVPKESHTDMPVTLRIEMLGDQSELFCFSGILVY